jgi:uncharacterized protein YprB with RNaseH-like and TPR domain
VENETAARRSVLANTFLLADGVGTAVERSIWQHGIITWQDYRESGESLRLPVRQRTAIDKDVANWIEQLDRSNSSYFARALKPTHHWRAVGNFGNLACLDIETDGTTNPGCITVIGIYDGIELKQFVQGMNLDDFVPEAAKFDGFVTFFGMGFDIPVLRKQFPQLEQLFANSLHVDLCPLLRELGLKGGLKKIEQLLGVVRRPETDGLSGYDAVRLWAAFRQGSMQALKLLLAYNGEDVENLMQLLTYAYPKMIDHAGIPLLSPD